MEWLQNLLGSFGQLFKWYFILMPWQQALRIRVGKYVTKYEGGIHFKIPYFDIIVKQNTRTRISDITPQTLTTRDNKTITLSCALSYNVLDIEPLYTKLHMAEDTIRQTVQGILSEYITWHNFEDCSPAKIKEHVESVMNLEQWGLSSGKFIISDFAVVKTYRFITGTVDKYTEYSLQTDTTDYDE